MRWIYGISIGTLLLTGCTKDIVIELPPPDEKVVVEGHISNGEIPYVILTRNTGVFESTDLEALEALFVRDATVIVSDGTRTDTLREYSSKEFPPGFFDQEISEDFNFIFYTVDFDAFPNIMLGEIGKSYTLSVTAGIHRLTSITHIPDTATLDSLWFEPHPDPTADSLMLLYAKYTDPDTAGNFARYFTSINSEPFFPNYFSSVYDDDFVNAEEVQFVIERGLDKTNPDVDFDTYPYFFKGDTVRVRWCSIDRGHYNFWRTADQQRTTVDNPFSTPTIVTSNVSGGLGVWGAYGVIERTIIVK